MWRRSRHSGTSRLGVEWRSLPLLTDYTFVFVIQIWNVMCFNPYLHICHCHWAYARHNIITKLTNQEFGLSTIVTVSIDICSITDIVWQVSSTGHNHLLLSGEHQLLTLSGFALEMQKMSCKFHSVVNTTIIKRISSTKSKINPCFTVSL